MDKLQERIQQIATEFVGAGTNVVSISNNWFFVIDGEAIVTVTKDFDQANEEFTALTRRYPRTEASLEDCIFGTIATLEPDSLWNPSDGQTEKNRPLVLNDNRREFKARKSVG